MKGITAFEAIGNLSDTLIMSAALPDDACPVVTSPRPSAFKRFMNSSWGVAAVCALVAVSVMGGILWAGNRSDPTPGGTPPITGESESQTEAAMEHESVSEEETVTDPPAWESETTEEETTAPPVSGGTVRLRQYAWDGWGISNRKLDEKAGARLIEMLRNLQPTGEYTEALASGTMADDYDIEVPETVERGTYWIEAEGKVYRVSRDLDAIWLVKRHYGGGEKLNADNAFFDVFYDLWRYHPYDSYVISYKDGDFTVSHAYEADSPIRVEVLEILPDQVMYPDVIDPDLVPGDVDMLDAKHKITLRITALSEDIETTVRLHAQYSADNLLVGSSEKLSLKAGVPQTVTLTYNGRPSWGIDVSISVENVRIYLYHME